MEINDYKNVEELGQLLTPPNEMASILGVDELIIQEELSNRHSPVRAAYMRGLSATAKELRSQMLEAAKAGSPSAIEQSITALQNCTICL